MDWLAGMDGSSMADLHRRLTSHLRDARIAAGAAAGALCGRPESPRQPVVGELSAPRITAELREQHGMVINTTQTRAKPLTPSAKSPHRTSPATHPSPRYQPTDPTPP